MQQNDAELLPEAILAELERVLHSNTFRNSDALRRLLKYLVEKVRSGDADKLKEYSIAIDALGKPQTYDPRTDATVRIQVGRLRQKLADYYRGEGMTDQWVLELPKGQFRLICKRREAPREFPVELSYLAVGAENPNGNARPIMRLPLAVLGLSLLVSVVWAAYSSWELYRERQVVARSRNLWTPELEGLWGPFVNSKRPLLIIIGDPPFVQFKGFGAYRDLKLNSWENIIKSPDVKAIQAALGNAAMERSVYYTPMGEANASFLLGKLLGPRVGTLSLRRASEVSWQELADNNVIYLGAQVLFRDRLQGMPADLDLVHAGTFIENRRPRTGEPRTLSDSVPPEPFEDGETHVLITHIPGPNGTGEVESFISRRTAGRLAGVQWFTDEASARTLVEKLKEKSAEMPHYYQVVLDVKFKDEVPVETSYVLHHKLAVNPQAEVRPSTPQSK